MKNQAFISFVFLISWIIDHDPVALSPTSFFLREELPFELEPAGVLPFVHK